MRQFAKVAVAVLVIMSMLLSAFGCATEPPAPTAAPAAPTAAGPAPAEPTEAPAPAPTTAAQPAADVIELKYHHHDPPTSYPGIHAHEAWAAKIAEATNGRVKITVYPAETLGKSATAVDMAINGIADLAWGYVGQFAGRFPVTDLLAMPMFGSRGALQVSKAMWEAYTTTPEIQKEWEEVHVLWIYAGAPHVLGFRDKRVEKMEDLNGLRLRAIPGAPLKFVQALGASPVTVPMPEIFEAVDKGTIDGYQTDWAGIGMFKFDDVSKYVVDDGLSSNIFFLIMNKKKWDSLPPDIQKVFNELSGPAGNEMYGKVWDEADAKYKGEALAKGVEGVKLSDAERARWVDRAQVVWDEYAKIADENGADGAALIEKIKGLYAKYQQ